VTVALKALQAMRIDAADIAQTALSTLAGERFLSVLAGSYDDGLLTLIDKNMASELLDEWQWLVPYDALPFAATAFGDIFIFSSTRGVQFLECQSAHLEFVDADPAWVLDEFIAQSSIVERVLRQPMFEALVNTKRRLHYGETFILKPWEMLGGQRLVSSYEIGELATYLSLVGQTAGQALA
jgi:hypothetical protein